MPCIGLKVAQQQHEEGRAFDYSCRLVTSAANVQALWACYWTDDYVFEYDKPVNVCCDQDEYLAGTYTFSRHIKKKDDRMISTSSTSTTVTYPELHPRAAIYLNNWDETFTYTKHLATC